MKLRLVSWNLNARRRCDEQTLAILEREPDVVALQEVTSSTRSSLRDALVAGGLVHVADSFSLAPTISDLRGPRRYGQLTASRWPLSPEAQGRFRLPWPERVLTAHVDVGGQRIELHNTHVPPGASNAWIKVETLSGLFEGLAVQSEVPRILCGDFNTPQTETSDGQVITWAQRPTRNRGWRVVRAIRGGSGAEWDAGERNILQGLAAFDLPDVYRSTCGYATTESSWLMRRRDCVVGRRFDHVFASRVLRAIACRYLHTLRDRGLSDHSPIEVDFALHEEVGRSSPSA